MSETCWKCKWLEMVFVDEDNYRIARFSCIFHGREDEKYIGRIRSDASAREARSLFLDHYAQKWCPKSGFSEQLLLNKMRKEFWKFGE